MNTTLFGGKLPMRATVLPFLAAVLFAVGCSVDATKFTCSSSAECPTGYHCDMGTATAAGTFKCASGAAQQKTLTANATKFLLAKGPSADGTVRTTISAGAGAVTSTPDVVGVRLVAKRGNSDVAESQVLADGSVLQVQVPEAAGQVSLRVQDDSGHSIPLTGYRQRIELSFLGKDVAGNVNPIAAYDVSTVTGSLFDPAVWIPGLTEIPASSPVVNTIASPAAYNGLASIDGVSAATTPPAQPTATGALGWEQISRAATDTNAGFAPSPRTGMAVALTGDGVYVGGNYYPYVAYGGADGAGAPADSTPTVHAFNPDGLGWTSVQTNTQTSSPGPFPSNFASFGLASAAQLATISRGGTALAPGGSYNCMTGSCSSINYNLNLVVAGGVKPDGTLTNNLFAYGSRTIGGNIFLGWWDETAEGTSMGTPQPRLLAPNAGMASTVMFAIPVPVGINQTFYNGAMMVGGQGIIPAGQPGANNDTAACQYLTTFGSANPTFQVSSCNTPQWNTLAAAGQIGYRTGQALTSTDDTFTDGYGVYMFGGNRANGPAGTSGLQNDVWRGTISVVCSVGPPATPPCTAAGAVAQTQITWTLVPTSGTKPSARSGSTIAFNEYRKLTLYGGSDATGPLQDVWELDLTAPMPPGGFPWRRATLDAAPALGPGARTKAVMLGQLGYLNNNATMLFGGAVGGTPTSDVWVLTRQSAGRLLIAAPSGMGSPDTATNLSLTLRTFNTPYLGAPLYIWNGGNSRWDFVAQPVVSSSFATVLQPTAYLQSNGSFYFLMNTRNRSTPTYNSPANLVLVDGLEVTLDFQ